MYFDNRLLNLHNQIAIIMISTIEEDTLKENIYEKISNIKDGKVLVAINTIIDNLEISSIDKDTEKRDLTGYIKEWAKNI